MSKRFLGAASVAALMALGLAACGQESATYDDVSSGDTTQYSETEDSYPADDETFAGQPTDQERMAQETGVPNAGGVDSSSALREGPIVAIADVRVKSDAEEAASTAFEQADANGDGMLDRSEYMTVAMSAEGDAGMAPSTPALPGETVDPTVEPSTTPGSTQTAEAGSATVDTAFAEAAGDDSILSKEELRAAFLARFDEADADGDAQLSDEEQMTFAALTAGEPAAPRE